VICGLYLVEIRIEEEPRILARVDLVDHVVVLALQRGLFLCEHSLDDLAGFVERLEPAANGFEVDAEAPMFGRNTDEIEKTLMLALCYKAPKQREETLAGIVAMMGQTTPEKARDRIIIGGKQECVDKIERFIKAGVTHFIFMYNPLMTVGEDIQAFAEDIIPQFRSR